MKPVFIVMIRDICEPSDTGNTIINECEVFGTRNKARKHLQNVATDYKINCINEYLAGGDVGFDEETKKAYVMLEGEDGFTFYKQGRYNDNHIEVWIEEKELNKEAN